MELKQYLSLFKKYAVFIILCFVLGAISGTTTTNLLPSGYNQSQTFYLTTPSQNGQPQLYNYDGFYAQERARNFTDTAVAILESGDFQSEVIISGQALVVKKLAPQVIILTAIGQSQESAKDLMRKTTDSYNRKFSYINLAPIASPQEPSFKRSSRKVYAAAGAVLGLTLSVIVISLKSYFKL